MQFTFNAFGTNMFTFVGPDPFSSDASRNSAAMGVTTLTLHEDARSSTVVMQDNDTNLHDGDTDQDLVQPIQINGQSYGSGTDVEIEYSYILMPVGSSTPADAVTIYVLEFNGAVQGVTMVGTMQRGVPYKILVEGSDNPAVSYDQLPICFRRGTRLVTPQGLRPVQDLREGDRVQTADHGWQPVAWVLAERMPGLGRKAPVRVAAGAMGNGQTVTVSPQHRLLLPRALMPGDEGLVPAKALVGWPGVSRAPEPVVEWWHLLLDRHEVIFAEGLAAESLLPGPRVWRGLQPFARVSLARVWQADRVMQPARRLIRPGRFARLGLRHACNCPSRAGA